MQYRRFGRTELSMPVISCGGMRYQHKWGDTPPEEIPADGQANLEATIHRALELGINHIETARGYGTSEMQLGWVLPKIPRDKLIIQTKVGPHEDPKAFLETFEKSMKYLQLDHVDLLAFHGINNDELLDQVVRPGGCMDVVRKLQKDGRVRFVGFSTHGACASIVRACETGEFDYVNVHWYYVNNRNWPAIEAATKQDMGVFIISPSDKGGRLYEPPQKLVDLCAPLSPIGFNDLFCLARPQVHTLSVGASRPQDFDAHVESLEFYDSIDETIAPIEARLKAEIEKEFGPRWLQDFEAGLPEFEDVPGEINVLEILRVYTFARSLDLVTWGKERYNILGNGGHWAPGQNAACLDEKLSEIVPILATSPFADKIPGLLRESHEMLRGEEKKRLSESE